MNEELKIKISVDTDKLSKGCKDATKAIGDVETSAEKAGKKVDSSFSKMGDAAKKAGAFMGKAFAVGATAVATGVVAIATSAIKSYAEYEQLAGGVETLFKDSAGTVSKYASEAYKTAGISANEYMSTVTSFSASLLQSLGGDTAKASEYANQAIIDMSDNANKMGTSMEAIQNAYQGFAKGNYTMLDNLKLGYGGTKEEMARLVADAAKLDSSIKANDMSFGNITKAIHAVQTELGITGTTALEASSTISGSVGMMKSAWANLMTGIADENADFDGLINNLVDSVTAVGENILPRVEVALHGVASLIEKLLPTIAEKLPPLVSSLLPKLLSAVINILSTLIQGIVQVLPSLINTIVEALPQLIEALVQALTAIVEALPEVIKTIVNALPKLLPQLIEGIVSLVVTIANNLMDIIEPILMALPDILMSIVDALIENLPTLITGLIGLIISIVEKLPTILLALVQAIPDIISGLVEAVWSCLPAILKGVVDLVVALAKALPDILKLLWELLTVQFKTWWESIKKVFALVDSWFGGVFSKAWEAIKNAFKPIVEWFKSVFDSIKNVFNIVGSWFGSKFKEGYNKIKEAISPIINFFGDIWSKIKAKFTSMGQAIGDAISGAVKGAINKVLNFATNTINKFINAINGAISIINKIPGVNINKIGKLSVPQLAKGGVVDSATLAVIGERGKEAVMPLENNTEWMDTLADRINRNSNTPIILQVDGKTFAQTTIKTLNDLTTQTGSLPLKLA